MTATFLISTPTVFRHSFISETVSILQLPSNAGDYGTLAHKEHFFALSIGTSATDRPGVGRFNADPDEIAGLIALFYGKGVRNHGPVMIDSELLLPNLLGIPPNPYFDLAIYSASHTKLPVVECDWRGATALEGFFKHIAPREPGPSAIVDAARCYSAALNLLPLDRELAYFRLIQALECVSGNAEFTEEEKFSHDEQLWYYLEWLEALDDPKGKQCARFMKGRLYQVTRRVQLWLRTRIDEKFYAREPWAIEAEHLGSVIGVGRQTPPLF